MHYRFIQQITAYHDDGQVKYHDYVAYTGTTSYAEGKTSIDFAPAAGEGSVELALKFEADELVILIGDVETRGEQNTWVRIAKPSSNTFGSDTECEIWVGSQKPPNEEPNKRLN